MNKKVLLLCAGVGTIVGAYVPVLLFSASELSGWSMLGSVIGGLAGIWAGVKFSNYFAD